MNNSVPDKKDTQIAVLSISTERLELIPATLAILTGDLRDRTALSRLLDATIPASWPPPLMDKEVLTEFVRMRSENTDPLFTTWYWMLVDPVTGTRTLIGSGGIASTTTATDTVVMGYSVLDEFQNRGYATEAIRHLIPIIFSLPGIRKILATTYPDLKPSIRVLEKNGFVCTGVCHEGEGIEEGTVAFILERQDFHPLK
ncbi:MAG: N-acetyltransferase [Methanomicrobiales archaeon HGW-Methanomicrobiales-1]|jgi:RimJ/RimL family protein N-acetyltransferase|nr:MAG: N-acetyltransferase [Methanomicrobiales archaeon HGW-Methanomicrobiales-1]